MEIRDKSKKKQGKTKKGSDHNFSLFQYNQEDKKYSGHW